MITGATGMVGQALVSVLQPEHQLYLVGREKKKLNRIFVDTNIICLDWDELDSFKDHIDIIIHLAGKNIGDSFWTKKTKDAILESRIQTSTLLINWIKKQDFKPRILVANAVSYYGCFDKSLGFAFDEERKIDETHPSCFLQKVSVEWQNVWKDSNLGLDICWMRFGVVLKRNKGMLKKMYPSFLFGMGAVLGAGKQQISWIHLNDLVHAIQWLISHPELNGPINMTTPYPVSQYEFGSIFSKILHRPFWFKMPSFVVKSIFGQMGYELLLLGQEVYPRKLLNSGFEFEFAQLEEALDNDYH